jgi:hypothetical protein
MAGARSGRAHNSDGRRYIGGFDELISTFLELEATYRDCRLSRHRAIFSTEALPICLDNLPLICQLTMLSKDTSGLGVGCLSPVVSSPCFGPFDHGLTSGRKRKYKMNQQIQLKTTASSLRNLVSRSPHCGKYERQSRKR